MKIKKIKFVFAIAVVAFIGSLLSFSRAYADVSYDVDDFDNSQSINDSGTVILTGRNSDTRVYVGAGVSTLIMSDCSVKALIFKGSCNLVLVGANYIKYYEGCSILNEYGNLSISGTGSVTIRGDISVSYNSSATLSFTGGNIIYGDEDLEIYGNYVNVTNTTIYSNEMFCIFRSTYTMNITNSTITLGVSDEDEYADTSCITSSNAINITNSTITVNRYPWGDYESDSAGYYLDGTSTNSISGTTITINNSNIYTTQGFDGTLSGDHSRSYTYGYGIYGSNVYVYDSYISSNSNAIGTANSGDIVYVKDSTVLGGINQLYYYYNDMSSADDYAIYRSASSVDIVNSLVTGGVFGVYGKMYSATNISSVWDISDLPSYRSVSIDSDSIVTQYTVQPQFRYWTQNTNSYYSTLVYTKCSSSYYGIRLILDGISLIDTSANLNISIDGNNSKTVSTTTGYLYTMLTANTEHTVEVYYNGNRYSNTFTLTTASSPTVTLYLRNLTSISASVSSSSVYYGQSPNFTVTAIYSDSFTKTVTGFTTNYSPTTIGTQTVTISYTAGSVTKTCNVNVTVNNYVTQISAYSSSTTVLYGVTPTLYVNVTLANGTNLTQQASTLSGYTATPSLGTSTSGTQTVTLTYKGYTNSSGGYATTTCSVTVKNYIASMTATSATQAVYYGNTITSTATVTYATGSKATVSCAVSGYSNTTVGTQTVTLTYTVFTNASGNYPTCSVSVTVLAGLSSISATKNSQVIYKGDTPILTATAVYADGTASKTVTPTNNFNSSLYGMQTVTLSYTEKGATKTTTCVVNIKPNVTGLTVTAEPVNNLYGTTPQFTVTASYENGDTAEVSGTAVTSYDPTALGSQAVIYSYMENSITVKGSCSVSVLDYPTSLTVTPVKSEIYQNEELEVNSTIDLASGIKDQGVTATPVDMIDTSNVGTLKVTYSYILNGVTVYDTVQVNILPLLSKIDVSVSTVEVYRTNTPDIQVTAIYNDGKTKILDSSEYTIIDFNQNELGEGYYTITYTEAGITKTEIIYITVKPNVSDITVNVPNETVEGEFVDFSIWVTYEDGSTKIINSLEDNVTVSNYDLDKIGYQDIAFAYTEGGVTVSETVTIRVRAIINISVPLSLTLNLDSNTGSMDAQDIDIINNSREDVIVAIQGIDPALSNDTKDVLPSEHSDWDKLGIKDSFDIALGLDYKGTWEEKYLSGPLYVVEADKTFDIGVIGEKATGKLQVVGEFGKANQSGKEFRYLVNWIIRLTD